MFLLHLVLVVSLIGGSLLTFQFLLLCFGSDGRMSSSSSGGARWSSQTTACAPSVEAVSSGLPWTTGYCCGYALCTVGYLHILFEVALWWVFKKCLFFPPAAAFAWFEAAVLF